MGITLEEVVSNNLLSLPVIECLPTSCSCGAPIEFTDSLSQIYCSNPRCYYKTAARLEAMAKAMKADGWGESACLAVCKQFNLVSPFQIFLFKEAMENGTIPETNSAIPAFKKKIDAICDEKLRRVQLWEVVKFAGIANIENTARKIFDGYDTLEEAYEDIETGEVPFIAERLGIKRSETGVMAVNIYNKLIEYKEELLLGENFFEIYKPTGRNVYIAITGGVYGYKNKGEFVEHLNTMFMGRVNFMLMSAVTQQVDLLVADGDTSSNKFMKATEMNRREAEKEADNTALGTYIDDESLVKVGEAIVVGTSEDIMQRLTERL